MVFNSVHDFLQMGHYGFYVWMAYGSSFVLIAGMTVHSLSRKNRWYKQQVQLQQRQNAHKMV